MKSGLFLMLLLVSTATMADDLKTEASLDRCLDKATTTLAMNQCYAATTRAWDQEMNAQYNTLMTRLSGEEKTTLRRAQRAWLSYRDSWLEASRSQLRKQGSGSLGSVALSAQGLSLVRNQALMLQSLGKGSCANPDDC
ncbi:lysozyme inhibitor LprI family protein [Pantoea sp. KXB25]|uniref:lysozyme inhibitor LprI family protein n=1 Tax=unclassified Pantoea TaxID=2630326 RepID=UPI0025E36559|nr:lysozyme inhibitor LprI family protein [uncultured Pantoea sp.]